MMVSVSVDQKSAVAALAESIASTPDFMAASMVFGAVGGAAIHAAIQPPKDAIRAAIQPPKDMAWASHQMMVSVSADQYKLTNIVKWESENVKSTK